MMYFTVHNSRGEALSDMMAQAKRTPGMAITAYVTNEADPPMYFVGPTEDGMRETGAHPVFTFTHHPSPVLHRPRCWPDLEKEVSDE